MSNLLTGFGDYEVKCYYLFDPNLILTVVHSSPQVKQAVIWALEAGYRHIDCAAIYGNEVEIGEALQEMLGPDKVKQPRTVFITILQNAVCTMRVIDT